ncbi:hypothetical protein [Serratia marcescens]|uniref:hypothetical protein n=1 Tax=Serratia marcescens TaxID=615 RepID=UPI0024A6EC03|nr:hypothetical protein [Serratia marcescens]
MTCFKQAVIFFALLTPFCGFASGTPSYDVKADTNSQQIIELQKQQLKVLTEIRDALKKNSCTKADAEQEKEGG